MAVLGAVCGMGVVCLLYVCYVGVCGMLPRTRRTRRYRGI